MNKGQIVSGDFMSSVVIFLLLLSIIIPLTFIIDDQISRNRETKRIEDISLITTDILVKSHGSPYDWNATNVISIGFRDGTTISLKKIRQLFQINYDNIKQLLGIGGLNFQISFHDINDYSAYSGITKQPLAYFADNVRDLKPLIVQSNMTWDYYDAVDCGIPQNSRNCYTGVKSDLLDDLLDNQSAYKTIVLEEPGMMQTDVNISKLKKFLDFGGRLIVKGDAARILSNNFSMHMDESSNDHDKGTVLKQEYWMPASASVDFTEQVTIAFSQEPGDQDLIVVVSNETDSSLALIGYWNVSNGIIFYFSDINMTINAMIKRPDIFGAPLLFGKLDNPTIVSKSRTVGIIKELDELVTIDVLIWR